MAIYGRRPSYLRPDGPHPPARKIGDKFSFAQPAAETPAVTPIRQRLSNAIEGAAAANTLDPNSGNAVESFVGSALHAFSGVQQFRRGLTSAQQSGEEREARTQELRSRSRYYDAQATRGPTGMSMQDRYNIEDYRNQHILDRLRIAAGLRASTAASGGKVTPAQRVVLGRTERANTAAERGVQSARRDAASGRRDELAGGEEDRIRAAIRRGVDPEYVADSTTAAGMGTQLHPGYVAPPPPPAAPPAPAPAPAAPHRGLLDRFRDLFHHQAGPSSSGGQSVVPDRQAVPAPSTAGTLPRSPGDTGDVTLGDEDQGPAMPPDPELLTDEEIQQALDLVSDMDPSESRSELSAAGYSPEQIDAIVAAQTTAP